MWFPVSFPATPAAADDDDDVLIMDSDEEEPSSSSMDVTAETGGSIRKRKLQDAETGEASVKRQRVDQSAEDDDDDIITLD